ncbi:ATP-binding protein [Streptomyces sp. NPDC056061]|uniref:ATP-binding protein n=1 Tax=Streptomyces sp. NPDC056061 TaxID=3345700 RepID=UPI0035D85CF8
MIDLPQVLPPACSTPTAEPPSTLLLASEPQSAQRAREFARRFITHCAPDAPDAHVDAVVLVTSELVTNAYRYGTEPGDMIRVELDAEGERTRVEVQDPVRRRPRNQCASAERDPERNRGRGLVILDALCPGLWGCGDRPLGKFVWAEIPWNG